MDEICLRKPPIHLEGEHLLKTKSWRGRIWEPKFFMVLGNTLSICENSSMVGSSLFDVEFDDIDICDGHVRNSRKNYVIQIQLNNGVKFNNETEIYFAAECKKIFDVWSKGLVYAKYYWLKKSSVPSSIHMQIADNGNKFLLDVVMYNGVTASIQLALLSVFKDLVKQINRSGGCYCKICEVSEETAQLFVVDKDGKISYVLPNEKIYNYFKDDCKFYLMEKEYQVLVIFFEVGNEETNFISCTAKKDITVSEVLKIPRCRMEIPSDNKSGLAVYYYNPTQASLDVKLEQNDHVFDFLYDLNGKLLSNNGKIIVRTQKGMERRGTCSIEDGDKMKAAAAKMRAERHIQDDVQNSIMKALVKNSVPMTNNPTDVVDGVEVTDDKVEFEFPDQDLDDCLKIFHFNPDAYKDLLLSSAHSSSSELSTTDSMDNSSAILSSSFKTEDFIPPPIDTNNIVAKQGNNNISKELERDGETSLIMERYSELLEPVDYEDNAVQEEQHKTTDEDSITADQQIPGNDLTFKNDKGTEKHQVENCVSLISEISTDIEITEKSNHKLDEITDRVSLSDEITDQSSSSDKIKTPETINVDKNENIVVSKKSLKKSAKATKCQLCASLSKNKEKPKEIKTNILSFLNKTGQDQYLCLSGTHLRKINDTWSAVDGCDVLSGFSDPEWKDAMENRKSKENLGNFVLLFVQARRGGNWYVRQMLQRSETPVSIKETPLPSILSHEKITENNGEDGPIESSTDNVDPDIIVEKRENFNLIIDDEEDLESSFESSLEFSREVNIPFALDTEKLKRNFTDIKESLHKKVQTVKTAIPQMAIEKKNDFANSTSEIFPVNVDQIKGKLKGAYDMVYDTISHISVDDRYLPIQLDKEILSDEFITVDQSYVKPLKDNIFKICSRLESVQLSQQYQYGDDFQTVEIGWEIRGDFCTILANFLRIGLRENVKLSFFSAPTPITLWELLKDLSLAFKRQEFVAVVKTIKSSKFLWNDDQRFRFFFCELLNRSTEDGSEKLIVSFFQMFPVITNKLEKYYVPGSFWRMTYDSGFGVILDEVLLSMKHFNGWPFNLHIDFEYRLCPDQQRDDLSNIHEDSLVCFE